MNKALIIFILAIVSTFTQYCFKVYGGEVTIVYSANTSGKLRECSCPGDPYGGLGERVTFIKMLRQNEDPFLLVDAGNIVGITGKYELKCSAAMRIMNLMNYDVAAPGRLEMYNGIDNVLKMGEVAKFPIISTSFVRKKSAELIFKPYVILTSNDQKVGVVTVSDSTCFLTTAQKQPEFDLLPLESSLKPTLDVLSKEADFIVVLSHMTSEGNKRLLEQYPQIDLVVQGYGNECFKTPVQTPNGILVAPGQRGWFVGLITLMKTNRNSKPVIKKTSVIPVIDVPMDEDARKIIWDNYNDLK
ncbi:MAG: hypothetical protein JXB48_11195 [Candidatus Latescibacteria bacterium]|nr:hypothetical protein [Candidatus Latescibacterota bacterium]